MSEAIEDRNLEGLRPLPAPRELKTALPLSEAVRERVLGTRAAVRDLIHGRDRRRLLVVVGPCSIHDRDAALEYARRLARVAGDVRDELVVVMRTYFEKPRTTVGWKGLINDPHLDGSYDVPHGLRLAREILLAINEAGVPASAELLDPISPQFVADLLAWAAIGARTTESQTHRELASGMSMPVGFKNSTDGSLRAARDAMVSARHPHSFLGIDADGVPSVVATRGNPDVHAILRGGERGPNYDAASVAAAARALADHAVARPILVDCSHGNSEKDHRRQAGVCREVLAQVRDGQGAILGLMLESHLEEGRQDWSPGTRPDPGRSVTDACIGWDETEKLLHACAETVAGRRAA